VLSRREFVKAAATAGAAAMLPSCVSPSLLDGGLTAEVAILEAAGYDDGLLEVIESGFELVPPPDVTGKRVVLKPNLVDLPLDDKPSVTNPAVIAAAAEAFRRRGAGEVIVADGPALRRDAMEVVDGSGLATVLREHDLEFVDLSTDTVVRLPNAGGVSPDSHLFFGQTAVTADVLVSMPKMKTHHWAGASLSLKNMYGAVSGVVYGWPRNRFHLQQLHPAVPDFNLTLAPDYAIVDGVVGLQGDGPILGEPIDVGAIVMGDNLTAVDATCARIMNLDPYRIAYLFFALARLGPLSEAGITQRGVSIDTVATSFDILPHLAALRPGGGTGDTDVGTVI
jgi:uncharacterized protein (DUF362 family)